MGRILIKMANWSTPVEGIIHVPDYLDNLFNTVGMQMKFVTISDKNEVEAVAHIVEAAEKFFVERIKEQLLKQIQIGKYPNGFPFEGVPKAAIVDLDALLRLSS